MNEYVNASKLIKSVNNYQKGAKAALNPIDGDADYYKGKIDACEDIKAIIIFLQQEMWKPNEKQMKALKLAYEDAFECPERCVPHIPLKSLLADLQSL